MRLQRHVPLVFGILLCAPSVAHAHLVNSGMGPFYDGAIHFFLSPDDWLGLLGATCLAGLCGAQAGRWTLAALPVAWLFGATLGLVIIDVPDMSGLSILSFTVLGLLVALDAKLSARSIATLGGLFGLLHGLLNGSSLREADGGLLNVLGIVTTVFVLLLLGSALVVSLRPAWTRVAVRVAGSWVVAVGVLMLGWLFRGAV
jgi:hydrogenase/urease accessory protein HupE